MAIAKTGTDTYNNNTGSSNSFSHTLVSGYDRLIIVGVCFENNSQSGSINSVTYGGTSMTLAIVDNIDLLLFNRNLAAIYYLLEGSLPADGSKTVTANFSTTVASVVYCAEYTGVWPAAPEATDNTTTTVLPTISNTISPSTGSWVFSSMSSSNSGSWSHNQSQVELVDTNPGYSQQSAMCELRGASGETSLSSSFSGVLTRLVRVAASFQFYPVSFADGELTSGDASISGSGIVIHSGTGNIESTDAQINSTAYRIASGAGTIESDNVVVDSDGDRIPIGSGSLQSDTTAISGISFRLSEITGFLSAGNVDINSSGDRLSISSGSMSSNDSQIDSSGDTLSNITGNLQSEDATVNTSSDLIHITFGTLLSDNAVIAANIDLIHYLYGNITSDNINIDGNIDRISLGTGVFQSSDSDLYGVDDYSRRAIGHLITDNVDISGSGIVIKDGSGVLICSDANINCIGLTLDLILDYGIVNHIVFKCHRVYFYNNSTSLDFMWFFGDGTTSTDRNPHHTYTKAGTYTVIIIIDEIEYTLDNKVVVLENSFILDAGVVFVNYGQKNEKVLGVTEGGNHFGVVNEYRTMPFDGVRGEMVGGHRIVGSIPKIISNFESINYSLLSDMFTGSEITFNSGSVEIKRAIQRFLDEDYVNNIAIVAEHGTTGCYIVFKIFNAISIEDITIPFEDSSESVVQCVFAGCFHPQDLDNEPWNIELITID